MNFSRKSYVQNSDSNVTISLKICNSIYFPIFYWKAEFRFKKLFFSTISNNFFYPKKGIKTPLHFQLIKSLNALSPLISAAARFELIVEKIVNTQCVMALRMGSKNDVSAERKVRGMLAELDDPLLMMGGMSSFRQLKSALEAIAEAQNQAGR